MLKAHGWDVKPNGVSTCASPGTGPSDCGAGIKAGAKLEFNLNYASGDTPVSEEMQGLKSDFAAAGIDINLGSAPFDTIISQSSPCTSCSWQMSNWGGGWLFGVNPYPTGDQNLRDGLRFELLQLQQPDGRQADRPDRPRYGVAGCVRELPGRPGPRALAAQAPFQISEISNKLHGALRQSPILSLTPENWTLSK